jgi:DNA-binding NtrC family response regulator
VTRDTILVLEDDHDTAELYARALRADGHNVVVCNRFEDARDVVRGLRLDALLTDVRVGEYNGLQLAMLFRTYSPNGRLVVITGFDDSVIKQEVGRLRGKFFVKPVQLTRLAEAFPAETSSTP